jgi:ribose 5-phosphate isomerase B
MNIVIASDHAGLILKTKLVPWLETLPHKLMDLGAFVYDSDDDYTDYAEAVAKAIIQGKAARGILVCGSGVGASVAANKFKGIYACLCHDSYSAHQGVEHDNMNVLCLGGRIVGLELAKELVSAFLKAEFSGIERYQRRFEKIQAIENSR